MGLGKYCKEWWGELWDSESRAWQITDRILFIVMPLISFVLTIIPKPFTSQEWRGSMTNLDWVIPLAIWVLFLLIIVPYRLVTKYERGWNVGCKRILELELDQKDRQQRELIKNDMCLLIIEGTSILAEFKTCKNENKTNIVSWPVGKFNRWINESLTILHDYKLHEDIAFWLNAVSTTDPKSAKLDDFIEACKNGTEAFKEIVLRLNK